MWYELKRQFIDSAARTLWAGAWSDERERIINDWALDVYPNDAREDEDVWQYLSRLGYPRAMGGVELTDAAPPTPDYARLEAAILLGKLEQANRCELAVIFKAAMDADHEDADTDHSDAMTAGGVPVGLHANCTDHDELLREFASDVAMMAIGSGVSWTDDHEAFEVPAYETWGGKRGTRPFAVPHIEFSYEGGER